MKVNSSLTDSLLRSTRGTSLASDCLTPECQDRWWLWWWWVGRLKISLRFFLHFLFSSVVSLHLLFSSMRSSTISSSSVPSPAQASLLNYWWYSVPILLVFDYCLSIMIILVDSVGCYCWPILDPGHKPTSVRGDDGDPAGWSRKWIIAW